MALILKSQFKHMFFDKIKATSWENKRFAYVKKKMQIMFAVADQRLCFRYLDSTIPLLPKYKISSL